MKKKLQYRLKKTVSWMLSLVLVSGLFTLTWPLTAMAAATPSWTGTGSSAPYYVSSMVEVGGTIYAGTADGSGMWTCSDGVWTPLSGSPSLISSMVKGTGDKIYVSYAWLGDLNDETTVSSYDYTSGTWTKMGKPSYYVFCLLAIKGQNTDPDVIYAATADGLYQCTAGTSTWTPITTMCTRSIMEVGGTLYARMNDSVYTYSLSDKTLTKICDYGSPYEIPQTFAYIDGTLYFRDELGVYSYTTDSNGTTSCAIMAGSPVYVNTCAEINGTLYAGTAYGLYTYSGGSSGTWSKIPGSPNFVQTMLYSNGTLYVEAGANGALWRCSNGVWTLAAPGKINAIQAIGNAVYTGTDDAVWCYSDGSWAQMSGSPAKVTCMQNVDNTLYAGADDGVWSYSSGTWTKMSGSPAKVTCMLSKAIGLLNVGTGDGQLWSYNDSSGLWNMLADKLEIVPDNNNDPIYEISADKITSLMYINSFINVGGYSNTGTGGDVWRYYNYKFHRWNNSEPVNVDSVVDINGNPCAVSLGYFWSCSGELWTKMISWPTVSKATNMGGTVYAWGNKVWRYSGGSWTELSGAPSGVNWMAYLNGTPYAGANGLYLYTAPSAPTISSQPADRTVTAGDTTAFTVAAASNDGWVLSYQWQKSTDGGGNWSNVAGGTGATTDSYTTGTLSTANSGTLYRCIVTDSIGGPVASNPATLTVSTAPVFTPVTDITGVPATVTARTPLTLTSTVAPTNATNQTIVWSVYNAGTTDATVSGNTLSTTAAGTVTVRATITNGLTASTDYTQDFTITVSAVPVTTYTVTFNSNGSVYTTKTVNAGESIGSTAWPADPTRSSYTFGGWFTGENGTGTPFTSVTPVNDATTVYAKWTYSGGGGSPSGGGSTAPATSTYNAEVNTGNSSSSTLQVTVDKSGGTASVDAGSVSRLMSEGKTSVITVPTVPDVNTYTLGIPVPILSTQDKQGTLSFKTDTGTVTVPSNMLTGVAGISGSKGKISIGQGDKTSLSSDVKTAIGDKPLISLSLSIDGKQIGWNNPNAQITVSIPYMPTPDELANPESIVIWYIDGSGNAVSVPNGHYDPATGTVTFTTTHFSNYAVVYNKVSFTDVSDTAWYSNAVSFISARGITTGTGNGCYSPDAKLTRGEFMVMMMRAYGIAPDESPTDNFSDAGSAYYTGYLAAAKRLGISVGVGNNMFAPDKEITRQEMFTLLYNALKIIRQLPESTKGKSLSEFSDAGDIASWAKDSMTLLVKTGIVGGSGGKLSPTATTTRAEMAQVLYNLLAK